MKLFKDSVSRETLLLHFTKNSYFTVSFVIRFVKRYLEELLMNLLSLLLGIAAVLLGLCTVLNAVALIRSRSQQTCNHC